LGVEIVKNNGSGGAWFRGLDALWVLRDGATAPQRIASLPGNDSRLFLAADGSRVAALSEHEFQWFATSDGEPDGGPLRTAADCHEVALDARGRVYARSVDDVRIWEPAVGQKTDSVTLVRKPYDMVAAARGDRVAVSWRDNGQAPAEWAWVDTQVGVLKDTRQTLAPGQFSIRISQDGSRLLSYGALAGAQLWDAERGATLSATIDTETLPRLPFQRSHDREWFVTGIVSGNRTRLHPVAPANSAPQEIDVSGEVSLSPGKPLGAVVVRKEGALAVFDFADGAISPLRGVPTNVRDPWYSRFSPDGRFLALAGDSGDIEVFEHPTWRSVALFQYSGRPASMSFSPDSRLLMIGGPEGGLFVWSLAESRPAYAPLVSTGHAWPAEFTPDGRLIVAVVFDQVRLWEAAGGRPIDGVMPGTKFAVLDMGRRLATLNEKEVTFWRIPLSPAAKASDLPADVERRTGLVRDSFGGVRALGQVEWQARHGSNEFDLAPPAPPRDASAR
jgi:hypothetical protein